MTRDCEQISHRAVDREEALRLADRFEPAHPPFSLTSRLMRQLSSIVRVLARVMNRIGHQLTMRGSVTSELIGHQTPRRPALPLEEPAKEAGCGPRVAPCGWRIIKRPGIILEINVWVANYKLAWDHPRNQQLIAHVSLNECWLDDLGEPACWSG